MIEVKGDLWKFSPDATPALKLVTTNGLTRKDGAAVMGRGCARQAKDSLPGIEYKLGELLRKYGNRPFRLAALSDGSHLGSFPVKHDWKEKADPELIERSAHMLVELVESFGYQRIYLPRPGAGNGGLDYVADVKPVLDVGSQATPGFLIENRSEIGVVSLHPGVAAFRNRRAYSTTVDEECRVPGLQRRRRYGRRRRACRRRGSGESSPSPR